MTKFHEKPSLSFYETVIITELDYQETLLTRSLELSSMKDSESTALIFKKNSLVNEIYVISHPVRGKTIKILVAMKDVRETTKNTLIEYCGEKLAEYKLPTEIGFRDELPKTNVGKILRKDLRAEENLKRN